MTANFDDVLKRAAAMGLSAKIAIPEGVGSERIVAWRDGTDWSLPEMVIALGGAGIHDRAMAALAEIEPRLKTELTAAAGPPREQLPLAMGIGRDGSLNPLRVENDGSVRLSDADVERIADAVAARLRPVTP